MSQPRGVGKQWVTTGLSFEGYRIKQYRGVVRGIVVRSRSLIGNIGAGLQTLFGGNITLYTQLCERARQDAFDLMLQHGTEQGANAIISMRYDANEVAAGVTEVLAYGWASSGYSPRKLGLRFSSIARRPSLASALLRARRASASRSA